MSEEKIVEVIEDRLHRIDFWGAWERACALDILASLEKEGYVVARRGSLAVGGGISIGESPASDFVIENCKIGSGGYAMKMYGIVHDQEPYTGEKK